MKKLGIKASILAAALVLGGVHGTANATDLEVDVNGVVVEPIEASVGAANFGNFSVGGTGGSLTLSNSTCTTSGSGDVVAYSGAACTAINITSATSGAQISLSVVSGGAFTVSDGLGNTMTGSISLSNSSCWFTSGGSPLCSPANLQVGGSLTVGANQAAGSYSTTNSGGAPATVQLTYT